MPGLFVTATGTEIGKTFVTAGLLRAGRRAGLAMAAMKPVLSGYDPQDAAASDAGVLLQALGEEVDAASIEKISPFRFAAPLSPNMAAAAEGRALDFDTVVAACRTALRPDRLTLIEGIGGVMVPLDATHTVLDLAAALAMPVVLVSGTALGALSHCLTAADVLRNRGLAPRAIVLNTTPGTNVPLGATAATLAGFCPEAIIHRLDRDAPDDAFPPLLQALLPIAGTP